MNSRELQTAATVSRILRAARKITGLSQIEVARKIDVSQSAISKIEAAFLLPSMTHWYMLCEALGLHAQDTYETGFVDHARALSNQPAYPDSTFRLRRPYAAVRKTKVRYFYPLVAHFIETLGEKAFEKFCELKHVDADFFVVLDNEIGVPFMIDLLEHLHGKKPVSAAVLAQIVEPVNQPELHGALRSKFSRAHSGADLLKAWVSHVLHYEADFKYELASIDSGAASLNVRPQAHLPNLRGSHAIGDLLCQYRKHYLARFLSLKGADSHAQITESECHFKGHAECKYQIRFKPAR